MRKMHSQLLSGEVDPHLSDFEESEIKSEPEENDEFSEPTAQLLMKVDLVGNANDLHGYMTIRLACKF